MGLSLCFVGFWSFGAKSLLPEGSKANSSIYLRHGKGLQRPPHPSYISVVPTSPAGALWERGRESPSCQ